MDENVGKIYCLDRFNKFEKKVDGMSQMLENFIKKDGELSYGKEKIYHIPVLSTH